MWLTWNLILVLYLSSLVSAALLPPALKGGGGGGGGRGGGSGGGGRGSSGSSSGRGTGTGRGGSGDTGSPAIPVIGVSRSANYFGGGGGRPVTLPSTSVFSGRQMGGGVRSDVPGTRAFGSGYPYSVGEPRRVGVVGQPFPFGFWPVYWVGHGHSDEYGGNSTVAAQRPGGDQVVVQLILNDTASDWNSTVINGTNETYWMIGDRDSVTTLLSILIDPHAKYDTGCDAQNSTIQSFNSSDPLQPVHFENVIQWYRSSSYALAFPGYNNSYALPPLNETSDLGWGNSTALPESLQPSPFLSCINATIAAALPIIDSDPSSSLSGGIIAGIVISSIILALFLCCIVPPCVRVARRKISDARKASRDRKRASERLSIQSKRGLIVTDSPSEEQKVHDAPLPRLLSYSPAYRKDGDTSRSSLTLLEPPATAHVREDPKGSYYK